MGVDTNVFGPLVSIAGGAVAMVVSAKLLVVAANYGLKRLRSAMVVRAGQGPNVAAARRRARQYERDRIKAESRRRRG